MRTKSAFFLFVTTASLQSVLAASFIQNPSFEANYNTAFPHYGTIDLWTGGSGVNEGSGPFHNTATAIPDQARVGFIQGNGSIRQTITGLTIGTNYWLQFFYDSRNCCGGTIDLVVRFNGVQLDRINNVKATPLVPNHNFYYFRNVSFAPDVDTGELVFETVASGDATIVLDAVTLVQRDTNNVPVMNPSFEASGITAAPGYIPAGQTLAGWTIAGEGTVGVNVSGMGPFADNGINPDQDNVAFIQGVSSISQTLSGLVPGNTYQVSFAYNARAGNGPHLQVTAGTAVLFDGDVSDVFGPDPYHTRTASFVAADITTELIFAQTAAGDNTVLLDDIKVSGQTRPPLPCLGVAPTAAELAPSQTATITVTVPAERIATETATVTFRSPNPAVAEIVGAEPDGSIALLFDIAGPTTKTFDVRAVARGNVRIEIVDSAGLCTDNDVSVTVLSSFVRNASFESSDVPAAPGYGNIVAWTGGSGLNNATGPFHNTGTPIPDRRQVAFIQGSGRLAQDILGLTAGQNYRLQFRYDSRACCPPEVPGLPDLTVKFGGTTLASLPQITAAAGAGYHFHSIDFVPAKATGTLEFITAVAPGADATLLLDAVGIVQRAPGDIIIENPSFEATGVPSGVGYIQPAQFAGWTASGNGWGPNLDGVGPFTDNGDAPDQDTVALMQGGVSLSQNLTGFTMGQIYTLIYAINSRNCCGGSDTHYSVSFAGELLVDEDIVAVGGNNPYYTKFKVFTAGAAEGELRFQHTPPAGTDRTLLLDNVTILRGDKTPGPLMGVRIEGNLVRISWPADATGYRLQCATAITGAPWQDSPSVVQVDGNEVFVLDDPTMHARKFYRLNSGP